MEKTNKIEKSLEVSKDINVDNTAATNNVLYPNGKVEQHNVILGNETADEEAVKMTKATIEIPTTAVGYQTLMKLHEQGARINIEENDEETITEDLSEGIELEESGETINEEAVKMTRVTIEVPTEGIELEEKCNCCEHQEDDERGFVDVELVETEDVEQCDCERCEELPTLEETIKERCAELMDEIEGEPSIDGIVCYVGETVKQLMNGYNCNMYEFKLFGKYLVSNVGIKVVDTIIKAEMCYMNDAIVKFKINDSEEIFAMTVDSLMDLGLAIWIDEETETLNLSGIEYRGLTKICCDNEIVID